MRISSNALLLICAAACSSPRTGRSGAGGGDGGQGGQGAGDGDAGGDPGAGGDDGDEGEGEGDGGEGEEGGEGDEGGEGEEGGDGEEGGEGEEGGVGEGEGVEDSGQIQVLPQFVNFRDVEIGDTARRSVVVTNVGLGELVVEELELEVAEGGGFDVGLARGGDFDELPATLAPDDVLELDVTFEPRRAGDAQAELLIGSNDPVMPAFVVDLQGVGAEDAPAGACVRVDPENLNWGQLRLLQSEARAVTISNCGDEPVNVRSAGLTPDTSEDFSFQPQAEFPLVLQVGGAQQSSVVFRPTESGEHDGVLGFSTDAGELSVELAGRGVREGVFLCQAEFRVGRGQWRELDGGLLHAGIGETVHLRAQEGEAELQYAWFLSERPEGSRSRILPEDDLREVHFIPDVLGEYDVRGELTRVEDGEESTCSGSVQAIPERDIVLQVVWDTPADPDQEDEGFGAGADMDIHLLREGGQWSCNPDDCFYANPNPDWGEPFNDDDNPNLDIDDTDGLGPEQISLSGPEAGTAYDVGVHYFNDHGYGPSTATVRIFIRGELEWESPPTRMPATDAWWIPARIHWPDRRVEELDEGVQAVPPRDECRENN